MASSARAIQRSPNSTPRARHENLPLATSVGTRPSEEDVQQQQQAGQQGGVASSLDILFSYSRSQLFYGSNLPSSPSFLRLQHDPERGDGDYDDTDEEDYNSDEDEDYNNSSFAHPDGHRPNRDSTIVGDWSDGSLSGTPEEMSQGEEATDQAGPSARKRRQPVPETFQLGGGRDGNQPVGGDDEEDLKTPHPSTTQRSSNLGYGFPSTSTSNPPTSDALSPGDQPLRPASILSPSSSRPESPAAHRYSSYLSPLTENTPLLSPNSPSSQQPTPHHLSQSHKPTDRRFSAVSYASTTNNGSSPFRKGRTPSIATNGTGTIAARRRASHASFSDQLSHRGSQLTLGRKSVRRVSRAAGGGDPHGMGGLGNSTYGQTLFNTIAVLLGVGLLSEPLAIYYAGWILGSILLLFFALLTNYTAKKLARIIHSDPNLRSYSDIARKAFGSRGLIVVNCLFCMELFSLSVALVILFGDTLAAVLPLLTPNEYKLLGFFIILPTVFLPLRLLSFTSLISVLSTFVLIFSVIADSLIKPTAPGSLWDPMPTTWGIESWEKVPLSFGLLMSGFSGHACLPSLARDMANPEHFDSMVDTAYIVATVVYSVIAAIGYCMFGSTISEEITKNLISTPGFPAWLNQLALWMIVLSPVSKFALSTRPLNLTLETLLSLDPPPPPPPARYDPNASTFSRISAHIPPLPQPSPRLFLLPLERTLLTATCITVAVILPDFARVMAFLGSFSSFLICVIVPILAYGQVVGRASKAPEGTIPPGGKDAASGDEEDKRGLRRWIGMVGLTGVDWVLLGISVTMMIWGTSYACFPSLEDESGLFSS